MVIQVGRPICEILREILKGEELIYRKEKVFVSKKLKGGVEVNRSAGMLFCWRWESVSTPPMVGCAGMFRGGKTHEIFRERGGWSWDFWP